MSARGQEGARLRTAICRLATLLVREWCMNGGVRGMMGRLERRVSGLEGRGSSEKETFEMMRVGGEKTGEMI
jgi:hypothetical protein